MVRKLTLIFMLSLSCLFAGVESDFFRACLNGEDEKVFKLYETMGKKLIYAKDKDGNTGLHLACCSQKGGTKERIISFLLSQNIDVNIQNRFKSTPLMIAVSNNNYEAVALLLRRPELNPNLQDQLSYSPLHYAVIKRSPPMIELLLSHPATNPNFGTSDGASPLHFAAMYGYLEEAKMLIEDHRINLNIAQHDATYSGATPLHFAAMQAQKTIVDLMLAHGAVDVHATINQGLYSGFTPLHFAAMNPDTVRSFETIKLLLAAGANAKKQCQAGKTPIDLTEVGIIKSLLKNPKTQFRGK